MKYRKERIDMSSEKEKAAEQLSSEASNHSNNDQNAPGDVSRRSFLRLSALAGAGVSMVGPRAARVVHAAPAQSGRLEEATVADLQAEMTAGRLNSVALTNFYLNRIRTIDQNGPGVNSIIELNPEALSIARDADAMRRAGTVLGPLHGIPVLLKDNIDTGDA